MNGGRGASSSTTMDRLTPAPDAPQWKREIFDVIFGHETSTGRTFDLILIVAILASVAVVMLDSVASYSVAYGPVFRWLEWGFTVLFTAEYVLRMLVVRQRRAYALSFFGIIDLLSVLPSYLSLLLPGGQYLIVIRVLRVLRVFRVLKLVRYIGEAGTLGAALRASRYKITVFLITVMALVVVVGAVMYLIEGPENGFTSIPLAVYWAVVTITTVGYGDVSPGTTLGRALAAGLMIIGYAIIAVPTGIVSVELAEAVRGARSRATCERCGETEHDPDARFCKRCGGTIDVLAVGVAPR